MELVRLEAGRTRATIAPEAGGRLLQLELRDGDGGWLPLLVAPDDPQRAVAEPTRWGAFPMAPWPNRIAGGRFTFAGQVVELPVNKEGHAIHGLVLDRPWSVDAATTTSCAISVLFDARWPFGGGASQTFVVRDDGIDLRIEVEADAAAFPAGAGWHPWFRRDVRSGVDPRVLVDAAEIYEHEAQIPTGVLLPAAGEADLRSYPALGDRRLDTCYRRPRGAMKLRWADIELVMTSSDNMRHAVVYTPERAVCVEPQTCAIDAFHLDERRLFDAGTFIVEPGRPLVASTSWRWSMVAG
jgi:galactose mutarotase-like enzyme